MSRSLSLKVLPACPVPKAEMATMEVMSEAGFPEHLRMRSFPFFTGIGTEQVRSLKKKGEQLNLAELALLSKKAAGVTWSGSAMCYKIGDFNPEDFSGFGDPFCESLLRTARAAAVKFLDFDRDLFMGQMRSDASVICCPHCHSEHRSAALGKHHAKALLQKSASSTILNQKSLPARISMSQDRDPKVVYEMPAQTYSRIEATLLKICSLMAPHLPSKKLVKIKQAVETTPALSTKWAEPVESIVAKWDEEMPDARLRCCPTCGNKMIGAQSTRDDRIQAAISMLDTCLSYIQAKADHIKRLEKEYPATENFWLAVLDKSY